jgi:MYXO-CTERM domain-containing protein
MKKLLLLACSMLVAVGVYAQGTVNFANGGAGVNAPISLEGGGLVSTANGPWLAMLYAGPAGSAESALSSAIVSGAPAALGGTAGYVFGGARTITGVPSGSAAVLQIRAWRSDLGADYATALGAQGGLYTGKSVPVSITLGGGPTPTPNMTGLASFTIAVPEPSSIALGLLGLGAIALIRRRK